jgi:outer membrane protein
MKRSLFLSTLLATSLAGSAALAQAPAAASTSSSPAKVGVIMFQAAVMQTNEGKRDFEELEKKYQPKQTALKTQSDEIDTLKKQLQAQSATLSEAERSEKLSAIDQKEKQLQRDGQDAQQDFQQDMQSTFSTIAQKFNGTLQTYAKQNGYSVILDASEQQSPVLYANDGSNITEAVIAAYNQQSGIAAPPPSAPTPSAAPHRAPATH